MKNYPEKPKKRKVRRKENRFDKSRLTTSDLELLKGFQERRDKFESLMSKSNIIHYKKTCPACGFPTFEEDKPYETCVICLWEGPGSDKNNIYQGPPNYTSLIEHRIYFSELLQVFQETYVVDSSIDNIIKHINAFKQSSIEDQESFENYLKNVLPTKPKI